MSEIIQAIKRLSINSCLIALLFGCGNTEKPDPLLVNVIEAKLSPYDVKWVTTGVISTDYLPGLTAKTAGRVEKILVRAGEKVKKDQILIVLDRKEQMIKLNTAKSHLASAKARYESAEKEKKMNEKLISKGAVSQLAYIKSIGHAKYEKQMLYSAEEALKEAGYQIKRTNIRAPINGTIASITVHVGEYIDQFHSKKIITIVNNHELEATFPISQTRSKKVRKGQLIYLYTDNDEKPLKSIVTAISPEVKDESGYFNIVAEFKNIYNWKVGSSVYGELVINKVEKTISVPNSAVYQTPLDDFVYLVIKNKAKRVPIKIIAKEEEYMVITGPISNGEKIITTGASYLSNDQLVKVISTDEKVSDDGK